MHRHGERHKLHLFGQGGMSTWEQDTLCACNFNIYQIQSKSLSHDTQL